MYFPISGVHLNPIYLIFVGFIIGVLGGFFGVGGSFLTAPALFAAGLPMNFVVGTDLAHIVGKSIVAARTHRVLGNIDMKLAAIMVIGTIGGSEAGVQAIEILKKGAHVELVVGTVSIIVFTGISIFCAWESWMALRMNRSKDLRSPADPKPERGCHGDRWFRQGSSADQARAASQSAAFGNRFYFVLGDPLRLVHRWNFQRVSRRRCRLHSHALHGLSAGHSNSYRGRYGSIRDHHFRQLRHHPARDERERRYCDCSGHADRGGPGRPDRSQLDAIFHGSANPARVCPASALGCYRDCSETSHQPSSVTKLP